MHTETTVPFPSRPKGNRTYTAALQCEACWRVIKHPDRAYTVVADAGIGHLIPIAGADSIPNGGAFPIGPECAKDIPAAYKLKGWTS